MYKIKAYTAKTSSKKYWCQCNLWTGDFPAYIVGCLITCSTHQIARSSGLVIWSFSVEPISLAASANFGSWRSLSRACNLKKNTAIRQFVHFDMLKYAFTFRFWICYLYPIRILKAWIEARTKVIVLHIKSYLTFGFPFLYYPMN